MKKKHIRLAVDIIMTVLLLMLMTYSLIGEELHEIVGTVIFVLYITHHIINHGFYKALKLPTPKHPKKAITKPKTDNQLCCITRKSQ